MTTNTSGSHLSTIARYAAVTVTALMAVAPSGALAAASETLFEYDARGRLVSVGQSGTRKYDARYSYDKADNRISYAVTNAGGPVAIVPIAGGYRVIPLGS